MIKITKKGRATSFGGGRGMDNVATGAPYTIEKDGKPVGSILPESRRCFAPSQWEVFEYKMDASGQVIAYKSLKRFNSVFDQSPFKQAKEFAAEYFAN
ncbi:hypothetical protein CMI37_14550 [Candidatus Pacearchaeota archaeon]|nr:hypothetical protein [Candidatus Pacearchaeota archaeon]|tara:strand:- start:742 stop:1035 length:294 start_codon:yes stop_codon:yes gene_type:complete